MKLAEYKKKLSYMAVKLSEGLLDTKTSLMPVICADTGTIISPKEDLGLDEECCGELYEYCGYYYLLCYSILEGEFYVKIKNKKNQKTVKIITDADVKRYKNTSPEPSSL